MKRLMFIVLMSLPCLAHAHSLQFSSVTWFSGFMHPLQGLDHILTMLAVGFWAALLRQRAFWLLMTSALLIAFIMIKSVFSIGINALIVGCSAFFHGYAHGVELAENSELLPYSLGFVTSTLLLHGLGIVLMLMLKQRNALAQ